MSSTFQSRIRGLQRLIGLDRYQEAHRRFSPSLRRPHADSHPQAALEGWVLKALARPVGWRCESEPAIRSVHRVVPHKSGLHIDVTSTHLLQNLITHVTESARELADKMPGQPVGQLTVCHTHRRGSITTEGGVVSISPPGDAPATSPCTATVQAGQSLPANQDTSPERVTSSGACLSGPSLPFALPELPDPHTELSGLLRALPALLGGGRASFDTWDCTFELQPSLPGLWDTRDLAAVMLLHGWDPHTVEHGPRDFNVGSLILSTFVRGDATGAQVRFLEQRGLHPGSYDAKVLIHGLRLDPRGHLRPDAFQYLPHGISRCLPEWARAASGHNQSTLRAPNASLADL